MRLQIKVFVAVFFSTCLTYVVYLCSLKKEPESRSELNIRNKHADLIECYQVGRPIPHGGMKLIDVTDSERQPRPGKSIFFHETSCPESGLMTLTPRQLCSIESAANHNPNLDIFVLFTSPRYILTTKDIKHLQLTYSNIFFRNNDMWKYAKNSTAEDFLESEKIFESAYLPVHLSDFLRLVSIWKYGGIYMDTDIIVKRSFENFTLNYGGLEEHNVKLNNGMFSLDPAGIGHSIAEMFINDFKIHYKSTGWATNGPDLVTRVLKKVCNATDLKELPVEKCHGFKIYPRFMFWAVSFTKAKDFFDPEKLRVLEEQTKNSLSIHVFNHITKDIKHKIGTKSLYGLLSKENCPLTYSNVGDFL